ncbi:MAG: hypothetical protein HYY84_20345 [Deltaproteobacteria bacterium]|nr:hypothetical protein [Deltaproteobacteria bacterium]
MRDLRAINIGSWGIALIGAVACGSAPAGDEGETAPPPPAVANGRWSVESIAGDDLLSVWGSAANDVFAGSRDGMIYRFNGNQWTVSMRGSMPVTGLWGTGRSSLIAVTDGVFVYRFDGAEWDRAAITYASGFQFQAVWGSREDDVWAVGTNGFTRFPNISSTSQWNLWQNPHGSEAGNPIRSVWGNAPSNFWAVAGNRVFHFDGVEWKSAPRVWRDNDLGDLFAVWGSARSDIWVAGDRGVARFDGNDWQHDHLLWNPVNLRGISGNRPDNVFFVGAGGRIWRFGGAAVRVGDSTFVSEPTLTTNDLNAVWVGANGDVFAVGNSGTVVRYQPN